MPRQVQAVPRRAQPVPRKAQPGHTAPFAGSSLQRELLPYAALYSASPQRLLGGRGTNNRGNNAFQEPRTSSGSAGVRAVSALSWLWSELERGATRPAILPVVLVKKKKIEIKDLRLLLHPPEKRLNSRCTLVFQGRLRTC